MANRKLISVEITKMGNMWRCAPSAIAKEDKIVRASTHEDFAKFLKNIQATDFKTQPKTERGYSYLEMTDRIAGNIDNLIWVWIDTWKELPNYVIIG